MVAETSPFLDEVDGELESDVGEREERVCEVIRRVRPDVLLGSRPVAAVPAASRSPTRRLARHRRPRRRT